MLLRTAAVEAVANAPTQFSWRCSRSVRSWLSAPFAAGVDAMDPDDSAARLLDAIDALPARGEAVFIDCRGQPIEW